MPGVLLAVIKLPWVLASLSHECCWMESALPWLFYKYLGSSVMYMGLHEVIWPELGSTI